MIFPPVGQEWVSHWVYLGYIMHIICKPYLNFSIIALVCLMGFFWNLYNFHPYLEWLKIHFMMYYFMCFGSNSNHGYFAASAAATGGGSSRAWWALPEHPVARCFTCFTNWGDLPEIQHEKTWSSPQRGIFKRTFLFRGLWPLGFFRNRKWNHQGLGL